MKYITTFCLLLGISSFSLSQTITIKDLKTEKFIEYVTIQGESFNIIKITNFEGQADITDFNKLDKIEIQKIGYRTVIISYSELEKLNFVAYLFPVTTQIYDEIVVSATRWSQSKSNLPNIISTINAEQVKLLNPQTAADLLGSTGEVFIQKSQQGGGSPMIRGFATNRLLYTVDGVRMNTAIFRAGNIQNVISLDPLAIESTEVSFGPGSIIYGSDAIGGVMSFQTLTPKISLSKEKIIYGNSVSRYSSINNEFTNHFDIDVGGEKWGAITSFTYSKFSDLKMGTKGPNEYLKSYYVKRIDSADVVFENSNPLIQTPSEYSQINLMQKIRFKTTKDWDFQYGFHYSETSPYSRYDRHLELESTGLPTFAVWNYGPQVWMMNNLNVSNNRKTLFYNELSIRLTHQYFKESRIDRKYNHYRLRTNLEEVQAYSINIDFKKDWKKHQFFYGVEYVLNDVKSTGSAVDIRNGSTISVPDRYPNSLWRSLAGHINHQFELSKKIHLQTGIRYNTFNINSDFSRHLEFYPFDFTHSNIKNSALTGSLGIVYSPDSTWKISINGSTGFRAPNIDDIGKIFDFSSGEVVVPNTSLKAEYAYNGEVSISKIFEKVVKLNITGYYTFLENAMVRRTFKVNGEDSLLYDGKMSQIYAIQNASSATVYGLNAGIEINFLTYLNFTSRFNYQIGMEEMDNGEFSRSRHAAPAFGMSSLTYQDDRLSVQFYVMYNAEVKNKNLHPDEQMKHIIYAKDSEGKPYSPGWSTLNIKIMYKFHTNFTVSTGIENLLDVRYRQYSSALVAPGRNFIVSLRANF